MSDVVEAHISATVGCAAWLAQRGHADLAGEMRDEFLREWALDPPRWNRKVGQLIDFASRKGESFDHLLDVRHPLCSCGGEDSDGRGDVLACPVHGIGPSDAAAQSFDSEGRAR